MITIFDFIGGVLLSVMWFMVVIDLEAINKVVDCVLISYSSGRMRGLHKSYLPYGVLRFKTTEDMFIAKLML